MSDRRSVILDLSRAVVPGVSMEEFTPDGASKPTQVHIVLDMGERGIQVMRLKSKEGAMNFVTELRACIGRVWPETCT